MDKTTVDMNMKLTEHFSLREMTKTKHVTADGNIPSPVAIENLKRLCRWLEKLRERYNRIYVLDQTTPRVLDQPPSCVLDQTTPDPSYSGGEASATVLPLSRGSQRGSEQESVSEEPIIINSGYRSKAVNKAAGGASNSNHLVGCAADIRCLGKEQAIRYACLLLDIADEAREDFDELIIEVRGTTVWVHFAVRPKNNRRKTVFCISSAK